VVKERTQALIIASHAVVVVIASKFGIEYSKKFSQAQVSVIFRKKLGISSSIFGLLGTDSSVTL
jgi:hypothetical protein